MLNKKITIKSIEIKVDGRKYVLKDENDDKFNFWKTKQDGTNTKAYDFFIKNNLSVGSVVEIGYKSEDKEYEGNKYEDRTILAFKLPTGRAPQAQNAPVANENSNKSISGDFVTKYIYTQNLNEITNAIKKLQARVHILEMESVMTKEAKEFHTATAVSEDIPIVTEEEIGEYKELNVPF